MPSPRPRIFARVLSRIGFVPRCEACGFPEPEPLMSCVIYDGEDVGTCEACGCMLSPFGRPVGDGSWTPKVIKFCGDRAEWTQKVYGDAAPANTHAVDSAK